jgi:hypothetical protein
MPDRSGRVLATDQFGFIPLADRHVISGTGIIHRLEQIDGARGKAQRRQ